MRLSGHALGQRKSTLIAKLDDLGEVSVDDGPGRGSTRAIRISAIAPGGGIATLATFDYDEVYRRVLPSGWELVGYAYEYRDPARGGRRAYHRHDSIFHAHCVDPSAPKRDHHYRAPEIDVFEAHEEFRDLYVSGRTVRCDDLRPALRRDEERARAATGQMSGT